MFKKIAKIVLIVLLVLVVVVGLTKDIIAKHAVSAGVKLVTGLDLKMESFQVGIMNTIVGIKELKLYNPKGYEDPVMVDLPEMYVDYDLPAIIGGKIHLNEVRLNLKEFLVEKNAAGELNLDALTAVQAQKQAPAPQENKPQEPQEKKKMPEMQIDVFELKIGKVIFKDYSKGGKPKVTEYNININERFEHIKDPYSIASIIIVKALANTTIGSLANFNIGPLQDQVSATLGKATELAKDALKSSAGAATEAGKKTADALSKTADKTGEVITDTLDKTTEGLKKLLPFGNK